MRKNDDLISRQAAIDAINKAFERVFAWDGTGPLGDKVLENVPSAQPDRKKGKWIYGEDEYGIDGYHCDKCGFFVPWDYAHTFINYIENYNFCPYCGAEMDEEKKEMINFDAKATELVRNYIVNHLDKSDPMPDFTVFTVWKCKTLQNWKYLLSSTLFDGMYYELTYNGDKHEWYLDAYKKFQNVVVKEEELDYD